MKAESSGKRSPRYGDAGDRWGVQPGDVWVAGPATLACVDVESDDGARFWRRYSGAALIYSDPPWSTGSARCFRTKAGLDHDDVTFDRSWRRLASIFVETLSPRGRLLVEIGDQCREDAERILAEHSLPVRQRWPITYYRRHPCWLLLSGADVDAPSPEGLDDEMTPKWAIENTTLRGDLVCDPCCGRGLTAVAAARAGRSFVGSELHPRRLAVALDRLVALGFSAKRERRL
jgi:hypothetical protein